MFDRIMLSDDPQQDTDLTLHLFQSVEKTKATGAKLLAAMPKNLRSGSIFVDDHDALVYLSVIALSCVWFFVLYPLLHLIIRKLKVRTYMERYETNKPMAYRYVGLWVANCHHFPVSVYLIWAMSNACSESSEFPVPGAEGMMLWFSNS